MATNAPGKHWRKGISLAEVFRMFPDDKAAERWIVRVRWPHGLCCPRCGSVSVQDKTTHPTMPYRCRDCRKFFSPKTGTPMESSNLGYQVWAIAIYLMTTGLKGAASMKLHRDLSITQKSAWHLAMRIRESWERRQPPFGGEVEADESYFGGKERNKHWKNRQHAGRGSVGKAGVVAVKDRESGKVQAAVLEPGGGGQLRRFVLDSTAEGTMVYTDEAQAYRKLPHHKACSHGVGKWVDGKAHTNGLESFWSLMKRGYHGTYHKMSPKHLDRYVGEFQGTTGRSTPRIRWPRWCG